MTGSYYKPNKLHGIEGGTRDGYHIRGSVSSDPNGMWQAWNGDTYLAGANGPMSLWSMGAFLYALNNKTFSGHHPGLDWFPPEPKPQSETIDFEAAINELIAKGFEVQISNSMLGFSKKFISGEMSIVDGRVNLDRLDFILKVCS